MPIELIYKTSQYCPGGNCVEAKLLPDGTVAVADTKNRNRDPHVFTRPEWTAFLAGVKAGEFDFPDDEPVLSDSIPRGTQ
ncbi:MAG: DUF397 domain-containing protein [Pseudonocardiaceae bacterium]